MKTPFAAVLLLVTGLVGAGTAAAQDVNAPPGNSGIDEYVETFLGPTGNKVPRNSAPRSVLPTALRRKLESLGREGAATAELAEQTAEPARRSSRRRMPTGRSRAEEDSDPGITSRALSSVTEAVDGNAEGGMGLVLPLILALSLVGAMGTLVARRLLR